MKVPRFDFRDSSNSANKVILATLLNATFENAMNGMIKSQYERHRGLQDSINARKFRIINKKIAIYNINRRPDPIIVKDPIIGLMRTQNTRMVNKLTTLETDAKAKNVYRHYKDFIEVNERILVTDQLVEEKIGLALFVGDSVPLLESQDFSQWSDDLIDKALEYTILKTKDRWDLLRRTKSTLVAMEDRIDKAQEDVVKHRGMKRKEKWVADGQEMSLEDYFKKFKEDSADWDAAVGGSSNVVDLPSFHSGTVSGMPRSNGGSERPFGL